VADGQARLGVTVQRLERRCPSGRSISQNKSAWASVGSPGT
jgi:hypothetical protein